MNGIVSSWNASTLHRAAFADDLRDLEAMSRADPMVVGGDIPPDLDSRRFRLVRSAFG